MWNLIAFRRFLRLFWELGTRLCNLKLETFFFFFFLPVFPEYPGPLPWLRLVAWSSAISGCWFYCSTSTGGVPISFCFRCTYTHYTSQLVCYLSINKIREHPSNEATCSSPALPIRTGLSCYAASAASWARCSCCAASPCSSPPCPSRDSTCSARER